MNSEYRKRRTLSGFEPGWQDVAELTTFLTFAYIYSFLISEGGGHSVSEGSATDEIGNAFLYSEAVPLYAMARFKRLKKSNVARLKKSNNRRSGLEQSCNSPAAAAAPERSKTSLHVPVVAGESRRATTVLLRFNF